jgi:hypothetical protein
LSPKVRIALPAASCFGKTSARYCCFSKDLVESAPATVLQAVLKEAAESAKAELEAVGAKVEIK